MLTLRYIPYQKGLYTKKKGRNRDKTLTCPILYVGLTPRPRSSALVLMKYYQLGHVLIFNLRHLCRHSDKPVTIHSLSYKNKRKTCIFMR